MPIFAITREMGSLGKDVASGLGQSLDLPIFYHEVVEPLADPIDSTVPRKERSQSVKVRLKQLFRAAKPALQSHGPRPSPGRPRSPSHKRT